MKTKLIWETNYRPIIRAVETEVKPRTYSDGFGLSAIVEAVAAKVSASSKVFRIENEKGVFVGACIIDWAPSGFTIPYLRLRFPSVNTEAAIKTDLPQLLIPYAPL